MKRIEIALVWSTMALACLVATTGAAETRKNTWGIYIAPTTHNVSSGTARDELESGTQLDGGTFYSRALRANLSLRIDAKWVTRKFTAEATTVILPGGFYLVPLTENFIEIPLMLLATRDFDLGNATLRISAGGGGFFGILISQDFAYDHPPFFPDAVEPLDAGGYNRYGVVGDGGVALLVDTNSSVFLNFRVQEDIGLSEEPENSVTREDTSFGFYAGFGWLF